MADAVFSLSAEINPQINERELERQASLLAGQLNDILAKKIDPVSLKPVQGSFRPFQKEIDRTRGFLDKLQTSVGGLPRTISNVARNGRNAFLKFTDAVKITQRQFVGFGKGIRDTIRDSRLFEDALDGIKATSSSIADLPTTFEDLAAQIRSGTSVIDRMAQGGDRLAQLFQPLQAQGEAARTEFVELNRSIDLLNEAVRSLARETNKTGSVVREEFGQSPFNKQIQDAEKLLKLLPEDSVAYRKLRGSIDAAFDKGTTEALVQELIQAKDAAQKLTGPIGRIGQFINEKSGGRFFADVTEESRKTAIALEQGLITEIRKLGGAELLGPIENFNAKFREIGASIRGAIQTFNAFRTGLANILPGTSPIGVLVDSIADSITFFKVLRAEGVPALQAIRGAATEAFTQFKDSTGITSGIQRIKSEITGLGLVFQQTKLGARINESLGSLGTFLNKNLVEPFRQGRRDLERETARLRQDVIGGLASGLRSGAARVTSAASDLAHTTLEVMRDIFKTHSDSKETIKMGKDIDSGLAHGIQQNQGLVNKAIAGLGSGLSALAGQVAQFAKSVSLVAGTALAGLGAVALTTGKNFNVLKQVINASLPVLVGSKEASAGLLVEINKLNDSSPFARDTFLEMTRVLAGFGVEAKKITPLVDAIQQTVAATGGSDQDLLELSQAFAKIQSQGRLTAESLQSFSVRGVDAVAILAQSFGKTTTEIRKMISDGLIPADKAIDVLTKGLKEKFDGATDAVARNFPGALQRVQARLRDIGGTLLTAFITPEGGGALVDFLNNMADTLSHINKQVLPALAPLLQKVANALVIVSEKTEDWVKKLSGDEFGNFLKSLEPLLPVLAGLAGLLPSAFGFIPVIGPIIAGLGGPFTAAAAAIAVFLAQAGKLDDVMGGLADGFSGAKDTVGGALSFISDNFLGFVAIIGSGIPFVQKLLGAFGSISSGLVGVIPVVGKVGGVFESVFSVISKFVGVFKGLGTGLLGKAGVGGLIGEGTKLAGLFPKLAAGLKFLSGPVGLAISIFAQLVLTSERFRDALGKLFNAVKPVVQVIGGVFSVAITVLNEAISALEPVFTTIVLLIAKWFEAMKPFVEKLQEFINFVKEKKVIENFFGGVKKAIETALKVVIGAINILIKAYNKLPFVKDIKPITLDLDADPAVEASKKAADEWRKQQAALRKAAEDAAAAVKDNYDAASKAVEVATKKQSDAIDQLRQSIDTAAGVINGVISAARAIETANAAVVAARQKAAEATENVTQLEKDYARALEDTISPANEIAQAERNLTKIRKGLTDLTREEIRIGKDNIKLQQELADLQGQKADDERAALIRSEERARINLNKAIQAEIDLQNELNGANKVSIDTAGLTLDQIRGKFAQARALTSRDRKKTQQEIADDKASARLDVEDAKQTLKDATEAKGQFEIDTNEKINEIKDQIRDNDERIKEIADDRADQLLEEQNAVRTLTRLREGETSQQRVILDFDKQINEAKQTQKEAAQAIDTATKGAAIAQGEYALKIAEAKGDANAILTAQQNLWQLQGGDLLNSNRTLRDVMGEQLSNVQKARDAAREMTNELTKANKLLGAATALQGASGSLQTFETRSRTFEEAVSRGNDPLAIRLAPAIDQAKNELYKALRTALASGAAEQKLKNQEPWFPTGAEVERVIKKIDEIFGRTRNLRDAVRDALNFFNLSMPGFAAKKGLSPGMIHRGMNNGVGLVRMFEYGKEAVLPLTRPKDMARIVRDPQVLPAVLKAIPGFARGFTPGDKIIENALLTPNNPLRKLLQDIFKEMGLQFPGFYTGYAPGDLAGSSLSSSLASFVPSLSSYTAPLNPILDALPRWSRPAPPESGDSGSVVDELIEATRSGRASGPANSDVYRKKAQREFADTIGEAVKVAVKEALAESDSISGPDVDINVMPATGNERLIAREVKRAVDKALGKW